MRIPQSNAYPMRRLSCNPGYSQARQFRAQKEETLVKTLLTVNYRFLGAQGLFLASDPCPGKINESIECIVVVVDPIRGSLKATG